MHSQIRSTRDSNFRKPKDRGSGLIALGHLYLFCLGLLAVISVAAFREYGLLVAVVPGIPLAILIGGSLLLLRVSRLLGRLVMAITFAFVGTILLYLDLHYSGNPFLTQGLTRDIGGAVYHHPFTHAGLVFGCSHIVLAIVALFLS
jgi:hypothetical protein